MTRSRQYLSTLLNRHLEKEFADLETRNDERRDLRAKSLRKFAKSSERSIQQLSKRGTRTLTELIEVLPTLPRSLKRFGVNFVYALKAQPAVPALLRMLVNDADIRWDCGHTLNLIGGRRVEQALVGIARKELASSKPNRWILDAVIHGLKYPDSEDAEDLLVTIFERIDLPGWLRGDAADGLGSRTSDRRTRLFNRAWTAALRGLGESDIDVQFWSMFAIASMANINRVGQRRSNDCFHAALPKLRKIATNDHRLAPGFWWPMSAEAEDAIGCIKTGHWPDPDAGERWLGNDKRGPWNRE